MSKIALIKDHQDLPDSYNIKIEFVTGKSKEYQIASHRMLQDKTLEFVTFEDEWHLVEMSNVIDITFDKAFSKIVALKQEITKKEPNEAR